MQLTLIVGARQTFWLELRSRVRKLFLTYLQILKPGSRNSVGQLNAHWLASSRRVVRIVEDRNGGDVEFQHRP
jgi:hypothetical protein